MTVYTTYFDANFMSRGLACLDSVVRHSSKPPRFLVLALDDETAEALPRIWSAFGYAASLSVLTVSEMERKYPALTQARQNRSKIEFYFTLTPFLCAEAVATAGDTELAIYLDADLYFFSDPVIAEKAVGNASVAVVEHRYPRATRHLADMYGRFNVGWLAFRRDENTSGCIREWQVQCLASCADTPGRQGFADQKYLDEWPAKVPNLTIITHPGVNLAPWNVAGHALTVDPSGHTFVDGEVLVFYHFHRLRRLGAGLYETDFGGFGRMSKLLMRQVYEPYLWTLDTFDAKLSTLMQWNMRSVLLRFESRTPFGVKSTALRLLAISRLFSCQRVFFHKGKTLTPWRGLFHA